MSNADMPLLHEWEDLDSDGRVRHLEQALDAFTWRELVHIAAAVLAHAHQEAGLHRAGYTIEHWYVTVEKLDAP